MKKPGRKVVWRRLHCSTGALVLWLLITCAGKLYAQPEVQKPARILFLLDASSSMLSDWNTTENRFHAASRLITAIVDSIHKVNPDVAFAVRAFGNQYPAQDKNCYDTRLEVPFGLSNEVQIRARLKYLVPRGYSPIAWSLKETAENDFTESNAYSYSIILITDGGESCGGDICATVTTLLAKKISFKPYILSLVDYEPLREQYACLGKYLIVAREKDIVPAINTIINDNRKILTIKTGGLKRTVTAAEAPKGEPITRRSLPPVSASPVVPVQPAPVAPAKKEEPVVIVKKEEPVKTPEPIVARPAPVTIDRIPQITRPGRLGLLFTLPGEERMVKVPPLKLTIRIEEETPAPVPVRSTPTPRTSATAPPRTTAVRPPAATRKPAPPVGDAIESTPRKEETLTYVVKTEEAKESTLQIYFTNGQGKAYRTEPRMVIRDSKTGREVKNIYRNVTNGEPDPIKLDPGTYDVEMPGSRSKASGIVIEAGKNKKYYMRVGAGSLSFFYPTAPNRPVKEFQARVSKRFENGPVVNQGCDDELPYDPDNYHVEITTMPPTLLNMDLEFNVNKRIPIKEEGTMQITNKTNVGKIQLWYQMGDRTFVPFYEMMIAGRVDLQKLNLQPGNYQVRYYKGGGGPMAKAEVKLFSIKSNTTTKLELEL
ncbi:vWA domain-containing protein [Taibaiella koreensis]|uniref:vWA domain-containing protein n=1 Tax=Taibaiella koreensis TaxID=1268548 RepID=UPI0013C33A1E|nr:vWA domain-containing protein [Taibaiella koreensis]